MEDTRDRLIRYLNDAWAVEKSLVRSLEKMADEVNDSQVSQAFREHSGITHQQEEALEARIRSLGEEPSGGAGYFSSFMSIISGLLHQAHDEDDKTTQDVMKAFAIENLEMAMYLALESYASATGDADTAALARTLMAQEKEAADLLWQMIPTCAARPARSIFPQRQAA